MSDKMMRIAGRGLDGKAKAIKTSNEGVQYVQEVENIVSLYDRTDVTIIKNSSINILSQENLGEYKSIRLSIRHYSDANLIDAIVFESDGVRRVIDYDLSRYSKTYTNSQGKIYYEDYMYEIEISFPTSNKLLLCNDKDTDILIYHIRLAGVK